MSGVIDVETSGDLLRVTRGGSGSQINNFEDSIELQSGLTNQVPDAELTPDVAPKSVAKVHEDVSRSLALDQFDSLLEDPTVEEIWINEPSRIFVARNGKPELTNVIISENQVRTIVERMLATTGRRVDLSNPFVDAMLPDGSRIHVAIPDVTKKYWSVNIRKFITSSHSLEHLVALGSLTLPAAHFLNACVEVGLNIVVAGATGAGKTTLMNALLNSAPGVDRIVTCEEVFELQLEAPDWVALQTRQQSLEGTGEISLRRLIKEALRMRPNRLVIGEVRQEECLDLLVAMNSGMPSMCSIHANGGKEAVNKLCLLPMLAGSNVSAEFVIPTVANVIDVIVFVEVLPTGRRAVTQIASLSGRIENNVIEVVDIFQFRNEFLMATGLFPVNQDRFSQRGYSLQQILAAS